MSPIRCESIDLQPVMDVLACPLKPLPVRYLGLPPITHEIDKEGLAAIDGQVCRTCSNVEGVAAEEEWQAHITRLNSDGHSSISHDVSGPTAVVLSEDGQATTRLLLVSLHSGEARPLHGSVEDCLHAKGAGRPRGEKPETDECGSAYEVEVAPYISFC